jgi:fructose-1,6-bisphosphatase/inositol monophosphatase family enzyme
MDVDANEFVSVMAPLLFRSAALASGHSSSTALHKAHEYVPGSENEIDRASRVDILSAIDLTIQEMLLSVVLEHWPSVSVLVEEETPMKAKFATSSDFHVLIDPVDGTKNYLKGDQRYCHIVSLVCGTEMLATLVYSHASGRLFVAVRGSGAYILSASNQRLAVQIPRSATKTLFHHVSRVPEEALRELGSAGFRVAVSTQNASDILTLLNGEANGFISYMPLVYDVWSPGMIIQEAGGWLSDWFGHPLIFEGRARLPHVLIAASSQVATSVIERLSKYI